MRPADKGAYRRELDAMKLRADEHIRELESRLEWSGHGTRSEYEELLSGLREKKERLEERAAQLVEKASSTWDEVKEGIDRAAGELEMALEHVRNKFL
ncbi:hypothetical protein [Oceanidesulfovibrio marinus]|uniref:Coiled coil domain-containing protein n=1 Tax=Oceanidesulfovibrio marinus TaxID=370038 RepID=A0A6P1ZII8_9BACT|nr:hypothetical protein [Oceanidesulfovibrio marinus]QJT09344.1 hypothetical protein E8L03_10510 [Oceanidesulfovibrio marinus]TVM32839.1 hypothetical protein DQK91_14125 [Oceanidesulfovibrio marinus]